MLTFLKSRWPDLSLAKWLGLFVFEFVVVLLGVLAAQSLQEGFLRRQARENFDSSRDALNAQLDIVGTGMMQRGLQAQCVRANLEKIISAVEENRPLPAETFTSHPPKGSNELSIWNGIFAANARKYLSESEVAAYEFIGMVANDLKSAAPAEEEYWATLGLAANGISGMGEERKTRILLAAHNLLHAYEGWDRAPPTLATMMATVGSQPQFERIEWVNVEGVPCAQEVMASLPKLRGTSLEKAAN